ASHEWGTGSFRLGPAATMKSTGAPGVMVGAESSAASSGNGTLTTVRRGVNGDELPRLSITALLPRSKTTPHPPLTTVSRPGSSRSRYDAPSRGAMSLNVVRYSGVPGAVKEMVAGSAVVTARAPARSRNPGDGLTAQRAPRASVSRAVGGPESLAYAAKIVAFGGGLCGAL